jgi:hypothetical protein
MFVEASENKEVHIDPDGTAPVVTRLLVELITFAKAADARTPKHGLGVPQNFQGRFHLV